MTPTTDKKNWWQRLTGGLSKTAQQVNLGIRQAVGLSATLDTRTLDALEDVLLQADMGLPATTRVLTDLKTRHLPEPLHETDVQTALVEILTARLTSLTVADTLDTQLAARAAGMAPLVMLVAGVNGAGKTTTIGKLSAKWAEAGHHVVVAAADTFRAGAVAQLKVWADRAGMQGKVDIVQPHLSSKGGIADPAGVAFKAVEMAIKAQADVVLIDTAGRLPNRADLMAELGKIRRVVRKILPEAPQVTLLVLDGTQGQAVTQQIAGFIKEAEGDIQGWGVVVTKLDGSGKAGFLVGMAGSATPLPVHYVGVGESLADIGDFDAETVARGIVGVA